MTTQTAPTAPTSRTDHGDIRTLVHHFFRALDARDFGPGWMHPFVTADVRMETPLGNVKGTDAVRATEEGLGRYDRTQHIASGILADVDAEGGRATASWNALMTHVHHPAAHSDPLFTVGGHYEAELLRTADGWRFSRVVVRAVWTKGEPPAAAEG